MGIITSLPDPGAAHPELSWLKPVHIKGKDQLEKLNWPGRKTEYWLHTPVTESLEKLQQTEAKDYQLADYKDLATIDDLNAIKLVFVDGRFAAELSSAIPDNDYIKIISQLETEGQSAFLQRINQTFDHALNSSDHIAAWQNLSLLTDGLILQLPEQVQLAQPVHAVFIATQTSCSSPRGTRIVCDLKAGASARLVEHFITLPGAEGSFTNQVSEIDLSDQANLNHYRLGLEGVSAVSLTAVHATLGQDATYNGLNLGFGALCKRNDLVFHHCQGGSHCELKGIYLPRGHEHIDYHTCLEHRVPQCTSSEVFRGIMADHSTAVFNGRIHIHQDAQKTLAELSNRNLLVSPDAEVYTKPELEIYADDVRCAHGATVAQPDEQARYYLQSRGINRKDAEVILSFAFINELIDQIELEPVANYLRPLLRDHFAKTLLQPGE